MTTKVCSKCGRELLLDQFNQEMKRGKLVYRADCKRCKSLAHGAWQAKRRKHYNRYMRQYGKQYRAQYGDPTHPERAKRWALRKALKEMSVE